MRSQAWRLERQGTGYTVQGSKEWSTGPGRPGTDCTESGFCVAQRSGRDAKWQQEDHLIKGLMQ